MFHDFWTGIKSGFRKGFGKGILATHNARKACNATMAKTVQSRLPYKRR